MSEFPFPYLVGDLGRGELALPGPLVWPGDRDRLDDRRLHRRDVATLQVRQHRRRPHARQPRLVICGAGFNSFGSSIELSFR